MPYGRFPMPYGRLPMPYGRLAPVRLLFSLHPAHGQAFSAVVPPFFRSLRDRRRTSAFAGSPQRCPLVALSVHVRICYSEYAYTKATPSPRALSPLSEPQPCSPPRPPLPLLSPVASPTAPS